MPTHPICLLFTSYCCGLVMSHADHNRLIKTATTRVPPTDDLGATRKAASDHFLLLDVFETLDRMTPQQPKHREPTASIQTAPETSPPPRP